MNQEKGTIFRLTSFLARLTLLLKSVVHDAFDSLIFLNGLATIHPQDLTG